MIAARGVRRTGSMWAICFRQPAVPGHREGHAGGREDGRVEGRHGREQAAENDDGDPECRHELFCGTNDCGLTVFAEELPRREAVDADGAERNEEDQEVDGDGDGEGDEGGARNVLFGFLDFFSDGGDEVIALEGDKGQTHGDDDAACAVRKERGEAGRSLGRSTEDLLEPVGDKDPEHRELGESEGVFGLPGHRRAPDVEAEEDEADDHGDDGHRHVGPGGSEKMFGKRGQVLVEDLPEVAGETEGVEAAGHRVGEPQHPA